MNRRSADDLDRAVLLARRAVTTGHLARPEALARFLYQRWYLGLAPEAAPRTTIPTQRPAPSPSTSPSTGPSARPGQRPSAGPWRAWNKAWEARTCRGADLLRLYLSCAPHTSLHVVAAVTSHAQDWTDPWLLSSRAMSQPVPAPDATVLYLPVAALDRLREPLQALVDDVQPFLAGALPAMTLRIAPGAALAQNPADGRPFGEHRCTLVAGTVVAHQRRTHRETVDRVRTAFRRAGIDPQAPYRAVGADWGWELARPAARRAA